MSEFPQLPFVACRATNKIFQGNKFFIMFNKKCKRKPS